MTDEIIIHMTYNKESIGNDINQVEVSIDDDIDKIKSFLDIFDLYTNEDTNNLALHSIRKYTNMYSCPKVKSRFDYMNQSHNYILLTIPLLSNSAISIFKGWVHHKTYDFLIISSDSHGKPSLEFYIRSTSKDYYSTFKHNDLSSLRLSSEFVAQYYKLNVLWIVELKKYIKDTYIPFISNKSNK